MNSRASKDLKAQAQRISNGYYIALAALSLVLLLSYFSLNKTLQRQGYLNSLYSVTSSTQMALRTTYDRATDLKDALRSGNASRRHLDQIRTQLNTDLAHLDKLHGEVKSLILELSNHNAVVEVQSLYNDAPFNLNNRLNEYIERLEDLLQSDPDTSTPKESKFYWLPIDATGANQGVLVTGYQEAFAKTKQQLDTQTRQIQNQHKLLTIAIAVALLLVTFLIFRPLLHGLRKVHTDVLNAQSDLEYLAFHDPVTQLPNVAGIARLQINQSPYTEGRLLLIRITNITQIGNLIGPVNLEFLFCDFAEHLQDTMPSGSILSRTGDTEFSVLITNLQVFVELISNESLVVLLQRKFDINGIPVTPVLALGYSELDDNTNIEYELANARLAASSFPPYSTRIPKFLTTMRDELDSENKIAESIRDGLTNNEFVPFYQFKVNSLSQHIEGTEALCRWIHPTDGLVAPGDFISIAERRGLIIELTWSMFEQVISDYLDWWEQGFQPTPVAINIAEAVLRDKQFCSRLDQAIARIRNAGIPSYINPIEIEITENVALSADSDEISNSLEHIRAANIPIAFDDFGTGFASLSSVVSMDLDIIKIDQSFVKNMTTDLGSRSVVESILSICQSLNLLSVAEGVETLEQAELLNSLNCDFLQGYYFHKPADFSQISLTLEKQSMLLKAS